MPGTDGSFSTERRNGKERRLTLGDRRQLDLGGNPYDPNFADRRTGNDRRQSVVDRRLGLDRMRGPGRRRSEERKAAEEGQMSDDQFEFVMAIDEYKRANARPFPTWTEVLEVIKALGYRRVAEPQPLARHGDSDDGKTQGEPKTRPQPRSTK
ncbi:MAG: hypothetical protein NTZ17_18620 [Phycisphaerae bacterium]|nr:hypothetical protein [Phycisphaerae bacterium]